MLRVGRVAVVAVWCGLLLALARSQWPSAPSVSAPPVTAATLPADDAWMGVYMRGEKVGYSHSRMTPVDGGYHLEESSLLRLSVLDRVQTVRATVDATTAADFALRDFTVSLDSDLGAFDVRGRVEHETLLLRIAAGGDHSEQRIALGEPIYLPTSARARLRAGALAAGHTITVRAFDPSAMEHQPLEMRVLGREPVAVGGVTVEAWKVHERFREMETTVWLDDQGRALREEGPMDMVVEREDAARAIGAGWGENPFDLMGAIAVRVREPLPDPRNLQRLSVRIAGTGDLSIPTDHRQSLRDGVLRVDREPVTVATYTLPYRDGEWLGELTATPFLQTEHPRIQSTARDIVAGERNPRQAAERLRRWVYDTLEKRPLASVPNAVQVLEMGAGDCNEHAVLFAALARAAGLPTRVVAGLVYADGVFLYHAWDEVWLGESWVSVDPAFDQMPADATHVKLLEGGPERHATLVPVLGKLSLDVLPDGPGQGDS